MNASSNEVEARRQRVLALHREGRTSDALAELEPLLDGCGSVTHRQLQAALLAALGRYHAAGGVLSAVLRDDPRQIGAWLAHGHALAATGDFHEAIAAYRRALDLSPQHGEAWWSLANLKTFRFEAADLGTMQALLERPALPTNDRAYLEFALAKALEDDGHFDDAFQHYARGNEIRRAGSDYRSVAMSAYVRHLRQVFTADCFRRRQGYGAPEPDPIFIVGLPRAGSTLIEQILASHSSVEATRELPDMPALAGELATGRLGAGYPEVLLHLSPADCAALGRRYLARTQQYRQSNRPFFIDKAPLNFLHVGLIQLCLPHARIIDVRREPMACCLSAYKQHFAQGYRFTYDLTDLGHYYRDYTQWMGHFDTVLPGRVYRVHYERLLDTPEPEIHRLLAYCGLPYEAGCLHFYQTPRAIATPSAFQVRQPLNRAGLEHWRHFAAWLKPLERALGATRDTPA